MVRLNALKPAPGSRHRRKIVGRGEGSGHGGKGSTRGFKGQTARSGDKAMRPGFEGGQVPLIRRIPKRGFNNTLFHKNYSLVNVGALEALFDGGAAIDPAVLKERGLVRGDLPVKILGDGSLAKAFKLKAHSFSKSALEKIQKAGGSAEKLGKEQSAKGREPAKA
jgi:large subunit ribosomal protein L15